MQRPLENGCARQRESERAEHERESEKRHDGRVETDDHTPTCCEVDAENRWHGEAGQERLGPPVRLKSALH